MEQHEFILRQVFGSEDVIRRTKLVMGGQKLIHYTSAENALKIIKNREIWLRNVRVMNDYMEVNHGFNLIARSLHQNADQSVASGMNALKTALDQIHPGLADETLESFCKSFAVIQNDTYITCLSEHVPGEQPNGRLSMWRNYSSGQSGVGLIINTALFGSISDEIGVFSSPVFYYSDAEVNDLFGNVADKIKQNSSTLSQMDRKQVAWMYFLMLRSIAHGSKHPGFSEEREWRVFHTYQLDELQVLRMETETIAGIPQRVLKLSLDGSIPGLSIPELISGILIGPSQYQNVIRAAIVDELTRADVPNADELISISPIPLRT